MAMGCDRGVHIQDSSPYTKDPWQIASMIVAFARNKSFDLIFTGMQSQDRGSAQVGVIVAELLGISCTTTVVDFKYDDGVIIAKRELEGRMKAVVKITTPALITCQTGAQRSPLSYASEHHEGKEEGNCRSSGRLSERARTDSNYPDLSSNQKRERHCCWKEMLTRWPTSSLAYSKK